MEGSLKETLEKELNSVEDWYKAVIFDSNAKIVSSKNAGKTDEKELTEFLTAMNDRDTTIGRGFRFCGYHFDVHRFHPPLVYGRRGGPEGGPEEAEGICLSRINNDGTIYFMVITYVYPIVSARAISLIPEFLKASNCKFIFCNKFSW